MDKAYNASLLPLDNTFIDQTYFFEELIDATTKLEVYKEKIKEELASRIPEPKKVKKQRESKIVYEGRYEIANNFTGSTKNYIIDLLKDKKCSELMLIN